MTSIEIQPASTTNAIYIHNLITNHLNSSSKFTLKLWKFFLIALLANSTLYYYQYISPFVYKTQENFTCIPLGLVGKNMTENQIKSFSLPDPEYNCLVYDVNYENLDLVDFNSTEIDVKSCIEIGGKFKFTVERGVSLAADFDIACEREDDLIEFMSAFYIGMMLGGVVIGVLGDSFGRKKIIQISSIPYILTSILIIFTPTTSIFYYLNISLGFFSLGISNSLLVMLAEVTSGKCREISVILFNLGYPLAFLTTFLISKVTEEWRVFLAMCAVGCAVFIGLLVLIEESPRFHLIQGDFMKAYNQTFNATTNEVKFEPFKHKEISIKSILILLLLFPLIWFIYSLAMNEVVTSTTDAVTQTSLFAGIDTFGYLCLTLFAILLPRRQIEMTLMVLMGVLQIIGSSFAPQTHQVRQVCFHALRALINPILGIFMLHLIEIYPTGRRSSVLGVVSSFAVVGIYFASDLSLAYGALQDNFGLPNLLIVTGVVTLLSSGLIYPLPETKNKALDELKNEKEEILGNHKFVMDSSMLILIVSILSFISLCAAYLVRI